MSMRFLKTGLWRVAGSIGVACLVFSNSAYATDLEWMNTGIIISPPGPVPVVDATNFINTGTIDVLTSLPFETYNTLNFTNTGTMSGSVGLRFETTPSQVGFRRPAANFVNQLGGSISGSLYTLVSATNLINKGILGVSADGEIIVEGDRMDLGRGGLGVNPIVPTGSINRFPTVSNFIPDVAIYDNYWGAGTNTFNSSGIINFFGPILFVNSPSHSVSAGGPSFNTTVGLFDPIYSGYTNVVDFQSLVLTNMDGTTTNISVASNVVRQAVFVGVSDPTNFNASIRFFPSSNATNPMQTVSVEIAVLNTNVVTASPEFTTLYFVDDLASSTNRGLLVNFEAGTMRPANYLVSRAPVIEYVFGDPGNSDITNTFLYNTNFTNAVVTANYSGYSALVDNLTYRPPAVPGGTYTNLTGRVDIDAGTLDMNRARIRGEGYVRIQADHLITSTNAIVDCENLNYQLASTNGTLRIQNLIKESVARMNGSIYAWSAVWSNSMTEVYTNYSVDTNTLEAILQPVTNVVNMRLYALILDAESLLDLVPVTVHDLDLQAGNNVFIEDTGTVVSSFSLSNSPAFTLNGGLTLAGPAESVTAHNWVAQTAPFLSFFTNTGTLVIASEAHFGDDTLVPYLNFVNKGLIDSYGQTIQADNCELLGTNFTQASFSVYAQSTRIESARISAGGDILLEGDSIKFFRANVQSGQSGAGGRITLRATNSLSDGGATSSNILNCYHGLELPLKPNTGDLLGTSVETVSPIFALVDHIWAGTDFGTTKAGYEDNVALGFLRLVPESPLSDFSFQGTGPVGTTNGLYVDVLDLSQLTDYQSRLFVAQNLVIYFAASIGVPEEQLNNQLDGRLRWVSSYAGPNSSVDVVVNGMTMKYNRARRFSTNFDDDGDGIPNGLDDTPFDGPVMSVALTTATPAGVSISWNAAPQTVYRLESRAIGMNAGWEHLAWATNAATTTGVMTFVDTNVTSGCYYRVLYNPSGF